jgi:hypothetical protein
VAAVKSFATAVGSVGIVREQIQRVIRREKEVGIQRGHQIIRRRTKRTPEGGLAGQILRQWIGAEVVIKRDVLVEDDDDVFHRRASGRLLSKSWGGESAENGKGRT